MKSKLSFQRDMTKLIALVVVLFSIPAALFLVYTGVRLWSSAAPAPVTLSFSPSPYEISPNGVSLNINTSGSRVSFVRADISFDRTRVALLNDAATTDRLGNVIYRTPMNEANSTGRLVLILGQVPGGTAPSGSFELARMNFTSIVSESINTPLTLVSGGVEAVDDVANSLGVNIVNTTITTPVVATATPIATVISTQTPIASVVPTPTVFLPTPTPADGGGAGGGEVKPVVVAKFKNPSADNSLIRRLSQTRFEVVAYDTSIGTRNGTNIKTVDFEIYSSAGKLVYSHTETDRIYCAFMDVPYLFCRTMDRGLFKQLPDGTYTIRARAFNNSGVASDWVSRVFRLDK